MIDERWRGYCDGCYGNCQDCEALAAREREMDAEDFHDAEFESEAAK